MIKINKKKKPRLSSDHTSQLWILSYKSMYQQKHLNLRILGQLFYFHLCAQKYSQQQTKVFIVFGLKDERANDKRHGQVRELSALKGACSLIMEFDPRGTPQVSGAEADLWSPMDTKNKFDKNNCCRLQCVFLFLGKLNEVTSVMIRYS